jgi:hypothetical protein
MNALQTIPFIILGLAVVLALVLPPRRDLCVSIALMPWFGLTPDIGVAIALSKYIAALLIFKYFLKRPLNLSQFPGGIILLSIFALGIASAAFSIATLGDATEFAGGAMRNGWMRVIVVLVNLVLSVAPIILMAGARTEELKYLLKTYIVSVLVLCVIGVVQFAIHLVTGFDILPLGILTGTEETIRSGTLTIGGSSWLRPGAFAGEPKGLGTAAATATLLLLAFSHEIFARKMTRLTAIALTLVTIYLTQSTSAFIAIFVGVAVYYGLKLVGRPLSKPQVFLLYLLFSVGLLVVMLDRTTEAFVETFDPDFYTYDGSIFDTIYRRTFSRLDVEDFDWVILKTMSDDPTSVVMGRGFGLGHLSTDHNIPRVWRHYMEGRIIFPKTGLTYLFVSGGVLGIFLGAAFLAALTPAIGGDVRRTPQLKVCFVRQVQQAAIPLALLFLLRIYIFDSALFITGALSLLLKHIPSEPAFGPMSGRYPSKRPTSGTTLTLDASEVSVKWNEKSSWRASYWCRFGCLWVMQILSSWVVASTHARASYRGSR